MAKSFAYARVYNSHQETEAQVSVLKDTGPSNIVNEFISSRMPVEQRRQLQACLAMPKPEHELVVNKLDKLGRTQVEGVNPLRVIKVKGIHIRTLDGLINTEAVRKMAPLVIALLTGLAELERELTREQTSESVEHRKRIEGNPGGRPSLPKAKKNYIFGWDREAA